jgi:hypothetical protein
MLEFLAWWRYDIYFFVAVLAMVGFLPIYAGNLACASYIKAMVDRFLDGQDSEAAASGAVVNGKRSTRAKTMRKKIHKQAKDARKANRSTK